MIKIMNDLETAFFMYIIILNENTCNNKNMSKIDKFIKKLENEECCINQGKTLSDNNTINIVWGQEDCEECEEWDSRGSDWGEFKASESNKGEGDSKSNLPHCKLCECKYKSEDQCFHKEWECHLCNKKSHKLWNCDYVTKTSKESKDDSDKNKKEGWKNVSLSIMTFNWVTTRNLTKFREMLIDSGVTAHIILNHRMFTQYSAEISLYQTESGEILKSSETNTICIIFNLSKDKTV